MVGRLLYAKDTMKQSTLYTWLCLYAYQSIDTSNPVVAGLLGHRYMANQGLNHKPSQMLADMIATEVSEDQMEDVLYNTEQFKKVIGR